LNNTELSKVKGGHPIFLKTTDANICSPNSMEGDCTSHNTCQTNDCGDTGGGKTVDTSGRISCQEYIY